jgi:hypothetical protein
MTYIYSDEEKLHNNNKKLNLIYNISINMFHLFSALIGYLVLSYDISQNVVHGDTSFFVTFSSWFTILTTIFHTVQMFTPLWYAFAYPIISFALFFMIPSAFFILPTAEKIFTEWILYDLLVHVVLPFYALTHIEGTFFRGPRVPFLISSIYFISYLTFIELVADPLPYTLNTQVLGVRIAIYITAFIVQCLGILLVTRLPYLNRNSTIPV